ncbi:MAG: hypothetical protein JWP80_959 [Pseudomonas sp.]|nr:hypothetical protein [Pseudomonas sp.]
MPSQPAPPHDDERRLDIEPRKPGFALRHFTPELEGEYRQFAYRCYQQTRSVAIILLILSLLAFLGFDLIVNHEMRNNPVFLPAIVLRLTALLIILFAANRVLRSPDVATGERWIPLTLGCLSLANLLVTLLYFRIIEQLHLPFGLEGMMLIQMAIFFPIGYSYRNSLYLGIATLLITYGAVSLSIPASLSVQFHVSLVYLVVASFAAGLAGYCQEQSMRTLFLAKKKLRCMANIDGLTQLNNRRTFDLLLPRTLQEAQREGTRVALIVLDLDHFKAYNDLYGHPAGDSALQSIATVLSSFPRRELDFTARLGGEEFALVLRNPDETFLTDTCEGIRRQIQSYLAIEHLKNPLKVMTASLGAGFSLPGDTPTTLYQRADEALYRAKSKGRNRVEIA